MRTRTHPTVSNQIRSELNGQAARKERQRLAAKKAWRTRRKQMRLTPRQFEVLTLLNEAGMQLQVRYSGLSDGVRWIRTIGSLANAERLLKRFDSTFEIFRERGWIECVERCERRTGTRWSVADGPEEIWDRFITWEISDKGIKVLEKNQLQGRQK